MQLIWVVYTYTTGAARNRHELGRQRNRQLARFGFGLGRAGRPGAAHSFAVGDQEVVWSAVINSRTPKSDFVHWQFGFLRRTRQCASRSPGRTRHPSRSRYRRRHTHAMSGYNSWQQDPIQPRWQGITQSPSRCFLSRQHAFLTGLPVKISPPRMPSVTRSASLKHVSRSGV